MAYLDQRPPADRAKAAAGVIGVHVGLAALLVIGLATTVERTPPPPILEGRQIPLPPPPPVPPDPVEHDAPDVEIKPKVAVPYVPPPPIPFPTPRAKAKSSTSMPDKDDMDLTAGNDDTSQGGTGFDDLGGGLPKDPPSDPPKDPPVLFDPVDPKPLNDPSRWITPDDYRTSWINRNMVGTAKFRLKIAANGRVDDCAITRSSGHDALDAATCKLIQRRAKFSGARNKHGEPTAGTFSSAVTWQVPK